MDILGTISVELVNQVLALLDRGDLIRISCVSRRLRAIVYQYETPCILPNKIIDDENECNVWLTYFKSILDLNSRIALTFEVDGSIYPLVHSCRLKNWGYLLHAISDLFALTCGDGHGRIVALVAWLPHSYAEGLFNILSRKIMHLRELEIHGCWDPSHLLISSDLFGGGAPALQSVILRGAVLPSAGVLGFASITYFECGEASLDGLQRQLSLMPHLRSLSVETVLIPFEIPDISSWQDSQPPLPGGIRYFTIREPSTYSISSARALAHVAATATANARDATIKINTSWSFVPRDAMTAFALAILPAGTSISILVERQVIDEDDETEDGEENERCSRSIRFLVVGTASMCDGTNTRTVTAKIHWEIWTGSRTVVQEFFGCFLNSLNLAELRIAFSELKPIASFQGLSGTTRALAQIRVVAQEKEVRRKSTALAAFDDFDMIWSWIPERDDVDLMNPPPPRCIRCTALAGNSDHPRRADIWFTTVKSGTFNVQPIFVDTILEVSGFSQTCPVKIELGSALVIQQKIMRWDSAGKALRLVYSRFSV